jgi:hypothetical protein
MASQTLQAQYLKKASDTIKGQAFLVTFPQKSCFDTARKIYPHGRK